MDIYVCGNYIIPLDDEGDGPLDFTCGITRPMLEEYFGCSKSKYYLFPVFYRPVFDTIKSKQSVSVYLYKNLYVIGDLIYYYLNNDDRTGVLVLEYKDIGDYFNDQK